MNDHIISPEELTLLKDKINYGISNGTCNIKTTKIDYDYDDIFKEIAKRFSQIPIVEHKCHNCGGVLEIKANDGIFKCPYCHSCYAIGTTRINEV